MICRFERVARRANRLGAGRTRCNRGCNRGAPVRRRGVVSGLLSLFRPMRFIGCSLCRRRGSAPAPPGRSILLILPPASLAGGSPPEDTETVLVGELLYGRELRIRHSRAAEAHRPAYASGIFRRGAAAKDGSGIFTGSVWAG